MYKSFLALSLFLQCSAARANVYATNLRLNGGIERIIQKTDRDDMLREVRSVLAKCVERPRSAIVLRRPSPWPVRSQTRPSWPPSLWQLAQLM